MNKSSQIFKNTLIFLMFLMLFAPLLQTTLNLFVIRELKGSFKLVPDIDFSFKYWNDGIFQENKEKYLGEHFGFRNTLVRANNQLKFNLFKKTSNIETVIGKENYLFAEAYIESYTGENFVGVDKIVAKCRVIKELQDKMSAQGKLFLPVLAPNKARVLKQYLPGNVKVKSISNYEAIVLCFKKSGVKYLDFNDYFIKNYDSSPYPLHPKYGVHWSSYGHTLAADSIINYINFYCHLNTPKLQWKNNMVISDSLQELDYDAGEGMNLLVGQMHSKKMAYPRYQYVDTGNSKPPLLVVGDSYNFGLEMTGMQNKVFSDYKFLYYFKELLPYSEDKEAFLKLNLKEEIEKHKVFIMIATEHNLKDYGWGFAEKALNIMNGKEENILDDYTREVKLMELVVRKNKDWYDDVVEQAFETKQNIDTLVVEAARYAVMQKHKKKEDNSPLMDMVEQIKANPKWMNDIKARAIKKGISLDSAIILDARWQLEKGVN